MKEDLKELGLSHYESKALETVLKESLNARDLSKKAGVPLGKVYSIISSLEKKELIKQTDSRPKLIYVDNASLVISKLIDQKKKQNEELISKIRDLATEIDVSRSKPSMFFQIGISNEEMKEIQLRTFVEAKKEVLQILNIYHKPEVNRESKLIWEKEIVKAAERGIVFKSIYSKNVVLPELLHDLNKKKPKMFQVGRFDTDFARCDIIDGRKVLIKLIHEDPMQIGGVIFIENEKLAASLTRIFNLMWENAD